LQVPDPNQFNGAVHVRGKDEKDWSEIAPVFSHDYGRSVGLADMAQAVRHRRAIRASGEQGMVVLDLMQGFLDSLGDGQFRQPVAPYERPSPLPISVPFGTFM
jgi:hypothetical protein